ncbi:unnamed protein product [Ectocarpus sp. CCAP 1310/34]|nr:unnamed protein product [Ectocarpus sp. CCAP 1310/34]
MADRVAGENIPGGPSEGDQSSAELTSLKADVGSLAEQLGKLTLLVGELTRKEEEPSDARGSDAGRGDARESAAAASAGVQEGASQTGSAQDDMYLRERFGDSGPEGRHSGEAGGYVPQEGTVEIPVKSGRSKSSLCQQYPAEQVELAFHAWNILNHALIKEDDKKTMKEAETPQGAIRELIGMYDLDSFMAFTVPTKKHPQLVLRDLLATGERLNQEGLGINEGFVLHRFVSALSDEYAMTKHALRRTKKLTKEQVMREIAIGYKAILDKQKKRNGARGAERASIADGGGRKGQSSSRGRGRGGRGRGGGGNGGGGGGVEGSNEDESGGAGGGGSGGGTRFPGRCYRCGHVGQQVADCTTEEKGFIPRCGKCAGWGHKEDKCATEEAVLAQVVSYVSDDDSALD